MPTSRYRILWLALAATAATVAIKLGLNAADIAPIELGSLHTGAISGVFFVLGFLLSATIADYKESERIPSTFCSTVESMYEDAVGIHQNYADFDLPGFGRALLDVVDAFARDVRSEAHTTRIAVHGLTPTFVAMERAGTPANFLVKLKQQQATLAGLLMRVSYIQRIRFIPSATLLVRSVIPIVVALLVLTDVRPLLGGVLLSAMVTFILVYLVLLLQVISTPFRSEGSTRDDVSMFLVDETRSYLAARIAGTDAAG
ncbi:hypothetical protein [Nocardioides fonticola]|uniref:hypothetical protein n=1 Tax=Nocardioides fonticola TaxID=450363 RepID=UPI0031DA33B4